MKGDSKKKKNFDYSSLTGMSSGLAIGVAIGVAMDNLGAGIAIGLALGAGMDSSEKKGKRHPKRRMEPPDAHPEISIAPRLQPGESRKFSQSGL